MNRRASVACVMILACALVARAQPATHPTTGPATQPAAFAPDHALYVMGVFLPAEPEDGFEEQARALILEKCPHLTLLGPDERPRPDRPSIGAELAGTDGDPPDAQRVALKGRGLNDEQGDVFDSLYYKVDGTTAGNETGDIMGRWEAQE